LIYRAGAKALAYSLSRSSKILFIPARIFAIFALTCSSWVTANEPIGPEALLKKADTLSLSQHPIWHKLLYYKEKPLFTSQIRSEIHDQSFFIANDGKTNPSGELEATLLGIFSPQTENTNNHPQCRFPARYIWLKKQLKLSDLVLPPVDCPDFNEWTFNSSVDSLSIVYASGYLGNPATYYGHTLLKLNSGKKRKKTKLLDQTVNYGVIVPDNEDPISYIIKSLFGGYDGGFSPASYHFHTLNYGEIELRNLWEYELNLSQTEVDFIVAHAWEVLGKKYTYYFFQKNCAYRLAELFEIIENMEVIPSNPIFTLPRTVLQKMAESSRLDEPLIRSIKFYPSRQARLYNKFSALTPPEKQLVHNIAKNPENLDSELSKSLRLDSKYIILDTLLDYYQFAEKAEILPIDEIESYYQKVLIKRYALPPGEKPLRNPSTQAPHNGRKASQIRFGVAHNEDLGEGLSVLLRPTFYDVLDADSGHVSDSALAMGEMKLFIKDDQIKLRHLDFFKIKSVSHGITGLPGDNGGAWKIKLGAQQQNLSCLDCLALKFQGDYGFTLRPNSTVLGGFFIGGGAQDNRNNSGNLFVKASIFSHLQLTDDVKIRFLAEFPEQIDGSGGGESFISLEGRLKLGVNTDLRFMYEKNKSAEYSINFGYYF